MATVYVMQEWSDTRGWWTIRSGVRDPERQELIDANLADGNVYSQEDPAPEEMPPPPKTVFRFVEVP